MIKYFVGIALAAVIGAGAFYVYGKKVALTEEVNTGDTAAQQASQEIGWAFAEAGEKDGVPQTKLSIKIAAEVREIGTYAGTCFDMKGSSWKMDVNEIAGAVCWFAGGGNEIGVFNENGTITVKEGALDEGDAETAGYRGDFVDLFEIK